MTSGESGLPKGEDLLEDLGALQREALEALVYCLARVKELLAAAKGTPDELKVIGRATSTASRVLSELESAQKLLRKREEAAEEAREAEEFEEEVAALRREVEERVRRVRLDGEGDGRGG